MQKRILFILEGVLLCLSVFGQSNDIHHENFQQFLENFHEITLPYQTRSIEELKIKSSFWGKILEMKDTIYYTPPEEHFAKDYWTINTYTSEKYKYRDIDILLFFLTGDCESGMSLSVPYLELCTYKDAKMVSRLFIEGGFYGEYDYEFYESTIEKDGAIRILEETSEYSPNDAIERTIKRREMIYQIDSIGYLVLLHSEIAPTCSYEAANEYFRYLRAFLFGDFNSLVWDESNSIKNDIRLVFHAFLEKYPDTKLANILKFYLEEIENNGGKVPDNLQEKVNKFMEQLEN
jgi:hypothetical protein